MPGLRVLVEFFDTEPIDNVLATCIFQPDIVVFLCDLSDLGVIKESAVYRLLRRRKIRTAPRFYYVDSMNVREIQAALRAVVRDYPGCVFNFSGGRDLMLILAGGYSHRYDVPAFYIDLKNQRFINVQKCAHLESRFFIPRFSAEDIFAMSGATIMGSGHFNQDKIDQEFEEDILAVWEIVRYNSKAWGEFVAALQKACAGTSASQLRVENVRNRWSNSAILRHLQKHGIMKGSFRKSNRPGTLEFKSALHKKCLLNQGIWLEMFCFVQARRTGFFDDVRTSVVVDWDGVEGGQDNTKNEIDVLLVKGVTPVFVSCKMGLPSPLALSEIRLLANKFGGSAGRAVVITGSALLPENSALQTRARDLKVHLIDRKLAGEAELGAELVRIMQDTSYCTY